MDPNLQPPFCLLCFKDLDEHLRNIKHLQCGHAFHATCIDKWISSDDACKNKQECPICVQPPNSLGEPQDNHNEVAPDSAACMQSIEMVDNPPDSRAIIPSKVQDRLYDYCVDHQRVCLTFWSVVALLLESTIIYLVFGDCYDILYPDRYPSLSIGYEAKGQIAIGVYAKGVVCIGVFVEGAFSVGLFGCGLFFFGGLWGGSFGLGVYHIGISWYCLMAQLSINIHSGYMVHIGINLCQPTCEPGKKRFTANKCQCTCWGQEFKYQIY